MILRAAVRAFAPGRVNLIGEHTDYNDGLCLPFAVEQGVTVTATPSDTLVTGELGEAYVRGVAAELGSAPARIEIESDLPMGAGLGSSAALCVAAGLALGAEPRDPVGLARACARVESGWAGAQTGLLDQLASLLGEEGRALLLDMSGPAAEAVPLELEGHTLAVIGSGEERVNAVSGYNERRRECADAARLLGAASLREVTTQGAERLPDPLRRRALHVIGENDRVRRAVGAPPGVLGQILDEGHASLRDLFAVSTPAVERTVAAAKQAGAVGARLMGGGFGGSVLALMPPGTPPPAGALAVRPAGGARLLTG